MLVSMVMVVIFAFELWRLRPFAAESDRIAVWRVQVRTPPMLHRLSDFVRCQRRMLHEDGLEGGEPLPVVSSLAVLVGSLRIGPDFPAENLDPLGPGEQTACELRDVTLFEEEALDAVEPMKKVRRCQILPRRNALHRAAELVNRVGADHVEHDVHAEDLAFPVQQMLALASNDRSMQRYVADDL